MSLKAVSQVMESFFSGDIRAVIDHAAEDDKITSLLIDLSGFFRRGFQQASGNWQFSADIQGKG